HFAAFDARSCGFACPALVRIGPGIAYFKQAYDDAARGQYSRNPIMVVQLTSAIDPAMAPAGRHVAGILAGYAPEESGSHARPANDDVLGFVLASLEAYAPGLTGSVLHAQVLTPGDLEEVFALPGGHVHHGDMALDQMFFRRPAAGYAQY